MTIHNFHCHVCRQDKTYESDFTTGYGVDSDGNNICYDCCAIEDKKIMRETGKHYLYLNTKTRKATNWPNSLSIDITNLKYSYHNFVGKNGRIDFWFIFEGYFWHGVLINPDFNQCARVRRTKQKAKP